MGFLLVIGICLVAYFALGIFYWQQGSKQEELEEQIQKTSAVVSKPLPSDEKLRAEYDDVNSALAPITVPDALALIVDIARAYGIDVDLAADKFNIPSPKALETRQIGASTYQVLPIRDIRVVGDPDSVEAFISDLDEGLTLKTMVLKKMSIAQTGLVIKAEEQKRREEFRLISLAVAEMMADNGLTEIPAPLDYASGVATSEMGFTGETGFPDYSTTVTDKGYTGEEGEETPKPGYVLYEHDRIDADDTTQFESVNYISLPTTEYYYTVEMDGTVRQFDGPRVAVATEYPDNEREARRTELYLVSLSVAEMMADNGLTEIPAPLDYAGGVATSEMGFTGETGFPDYSTAVTDKGYTGEGTPRPGYVLYEHDRIVADDTTQFERVSYMLLSATRYYYTVETDGTVRQFNGANVTLAKEYPSFENTAGLDVEIYTKPQVNE